MKKILITGASGFIGSFLVEEALRREWKTWAGIRHSSSREYLQDPQISFIDLHYSDKERLKAQLRHHAEDHGKWDYVIHNAGVTKAVKTNQFVRVNYLHTRTLVEALREADLIPEKFILISSLSAHSKQRTEYGKSKLLAEKFLLKQKGFPYLIFCPTGVYGPREHDYYLMLKTIRAGVDVAAGLKPQTLTFVYVRDLVQALFLGLESNISGKSYVVSDGKSYSDSEYTRLARQALGKRWVIRIRIPLPLLKWISGAVEDLSRLTGRPSTLNRDKYKIMAQRDWSCNIEPLIQDLSYRPEYDLERGLQESVAWYRENRWL